MMPAALSVKSAITHSLSLHHRPGRNARMLRGIHKASSNWLGKTVLSVIMGLLIVSFAVWGIGDIFRGFGLNSVAKIGNTEISIEQFRQYYTERLQQLSRQVGRPICLLYTSDAADDLLCVDLGGR